MSTKRERIVSAVFSRLGSIPATTILRNEALPVRIPEAGLIILRDGDPGEPDITLNPRIEYYGHRLTVEVITSGDETALDDLLIAVGRALAADDKGYIKRGTDYLAGVTAGKLSFSNTLERVRTIRDDGRIDGADPTIATVKGSLTLRFDGTTLLTEATSGDPIGLEYGFTAGTNQSLSFLLPRVFLPKPKYRISGPGGVEAAFDWQAAFDEVSGTMLTVTLVNDVASY